MIFFTLSHNIMYILCEALQILIRHYINRCIIIIIITTIWDATIYRMKDRGCVSRMPGWLAD